jgi:membrane associated rhomboid family serine protease
LSGYRWGTAGSWGGSLTPAVRSLLIANVAVFTFQILARFLARVPLERYFGLVPYDVTHHLFLWQPVTYMFLHDTGNIFHILFNMLVLWMFGIALEGTWGTREFLRYYFVTGIGAALCTTAVTPHTYVPTIGASGAGYGLLLAYGVLFPRNVVYLWGILPIEARFLVLGFGLIAFWMSLTASGNGVAHVAHLGGMLFGWVYLRRRRWGLRMPRTGPREWFDRWRQERRRRKFQVYYRETRGPDDDEEK